ncbi:MAG: glutaredoxin family protein [Comamonadaceae bacterium]|nr:MAG: glutaredoxin family protein [Comamonadaceae bacterium]
MQLAAFIGTAALVLVSVAAGAQPVYRNVDANGKVTFSDQPAAAARVVPTGQGDGTAPAALTGGVSLPFELRQVVQRYPVVIYTGANCGPCAAGRALLLTRGIPFSERTVNGADDLAALQKLSAQTSLPLLTIGSQQLRGFLDAEWTQYLDAAGYPKSVQLPAGYRNPPPAPLVALSPAPGTGPTGASGPSQDTTAPFPLPPPPPAAPSPSNPAGIRF